MLRYVLLFCGFIASLSADSEKIVKSSQQFAFDLMRSYNDKEHNLCFSPYSLSSALAMTYEGARGNTKTEMQQTLGFLSNPEDVSSAFAELNQSLINQNLLIANSLWIQKGMTILPPFTLAMKQFYRGAFFSIDFQKQIETARLNINTWVSQSTQGKIPQLLAPNSISPATRMVLASAIYLKARWSLPFSLKQTTKQPFYGLDASAFTVPMMTNVDEYLYFEDSDVKMIELLYEGKKLALLCVLPLKEMDKFEQQLSSRLFNQWLSALKPERIRLFFPKFKIQSTLNLKEFLSSMGMESAFNEHADFSGINGTNDLQISDVVHQAFIASDEAGTEAGAATAVIMNLKMSLHEKEPKVVKIDHPFFYFLYDKESRAILFMGRVVNPVE